MAIYRGSDGVVRFGRTQAADLNAIQQYGDYIVQVVGSTTAGVWNQLGAGESSAVPNVGDIFSALIDGSNATGALGDGKVAELDNVVGTRSWSMSTTRNIIEVPITAGVETVQNLPYTIQGSGSVELLFTDTGDQTEDFLKSINVGWTTADLLPTGFELYLETPNSSAVTTTNSKITFNGIITSADFSATMNELDVVTVNFVTTGEITIITGAS